MKRRGGIGSSELKLAARGRPDDAGGRRVRIGRDFQRRQRRRVAHEQRLVIGNEQARIALGEQMRLKDVVLRRGNFRAGFVDDESQQVIVKVLTDTGQVRLYGDAKLFQIVGRTDAGEEQKLRRADSTGADYYLAHRLHGMDFAVTLVDDAAAAPVLNKKPLTARSGFDRQVAAIMRRREKSDCGAASAAVANGRVRVADADQFGSGKVMIDRMAGADSALNKSVGERIGASVPRDRERPADAVIA